MEEKNQGIHSAFAEPSVKQHSILFVDDEEAILFALRSMFRREGYLLYFCSSGKEALELLQQNPTDIIVSDMRMPEMSGVEFLEKAKQLVPRAIRLMLSGYEDKTVVLNTLASGSAHYYFLKPWDDAELKALIARSVLLHEKLNNREMRKWLEADSNLPGPSKSRAHLRKLLGSKSSSLSDIEKAIESDPSLIAKLLQVANSIYYGARKEISTVRDAVMFIGTEYVIALVTAIEVYESFAQHYAAADKGLLEMSWNAAMRRASVADKLSEHWTPNGNLLNELSCQQLAYTASLLQDIGLVVRICTEPQKYREFLNECETSGVTVHEADLKIFGLPHEEIGALLLELWNFPMEIIFAVAHHHGDANGDALTEILQVADVLTSSGVNTAHDQSLTPRILEWRENLKGFLASALN